MDKNILLKKQAKEKLINGVNKLADSVKVTMGAQGKLVIIEDINQIAPIVTKDGVTVANYVDLEDSFENQGAMLMKQASKTTVDEVGDGTTTATVLAQALVNAGISSGKTYRQLQADYDQGLEEVTRELKKLSRKGKTAHVATVAANGDKEVGKLVAEAFKKTTLVLSEQSLDNKTELVFDEGSQIDSGAVHEAFKNTTLDKSMIIVFNGKLKDLTRLRSYLEHAVSNNLGVLLVVDDYEDRAMHEIMYNKTASNLKIGVIHLPLGLDNWLEDINVATGASPFNDIVDGEVGFVDKVIIGVEKTSFVITEERLQAVTEYVATLEDKRRIANLTTGVCTIKVGGISLAESAEKLDRVDDAIGAVSSSFKYGVVAGGGNALAYLSSSLTLSDEFSEAIRAPRKTILDNAELEDHQIVSYNQGYDVATGEYTDDLIKKGIVDSTEGIIRALESAVSVAKIILQTDALILTHNGNV